MTVAYALNISSTISGDFPVVAALINYKHLDKTLKIAALFYLVSSFFDWMLEFTKMFTALGMSNNLPFVHLFIVISIFFYAVIYHRAFFSPALKKTVIILSAATLPMIIFSSMFIDGIWNYPSASSTLLSILLICFSLAYFYQLLNRQEFIHIEKQALFWINSGVLIYFAINIFLFMLFRSFSHSTQQYTFMINIITNIIANILFTIGLLCQPQKQT